MQAIYKDTIKSVDKYVNKLKGQQLNENLESLKTKQPSLFQFISKLTGGIPEDNKVEHIQRLFLFSVQCYEHCYGKIDEVDQITIVRIMSKWKEVIEYGKKNFNPAQLISELNRINRQPDISEYLNDVLVGTESHPSVFKFDEVNDVKIKFLFIFNILNEQVKISYPAPKE